MNTASAKRKLFDVNDQSKIIKALLRNPSQQTITLNGGRRIALSSTYIMDENLTDLRHLNGKLHIPVTKHAGPSNGEEDGILTKLVRHFLANPKQILPDDITMDDKVETLKEWIEEEHDMIQASRRIKSILEDMEAAAAFAVQHQVASLQCNQAVMQEDVVDLQDSVGVLQKCFIDEIKVGKASRAEFLHTNKLFDDEISQLRAEQQLAIAEQRKFNANSEQRHAEQKKVNAEQKIVNAQTSNKFAAQDRTNSVLDSKIDNLGDDVGLVKVELDHVTKKADNHEVEISSHAKIHETLATKEELENLKEEVVTTAKKAAMEWDRRFTSIVASGAGTALGAKFEAAALEPSVLDILSSPEFAPAVLSCKPGDLRQEEKKAIKNYTGSHYFDINMHLRNGGRFDKSKDAQALKSSMASLPNHEGVVYRSDKMEDTSKLVQGEIFKDLGFLSASKQPPSVFYRFSQDSTVDFKIQSGRGKDISAWSKREDEEEVLFLPSTPFVITKVYQNCGKVCVEMTEITPELKLAVQTNLAEAGKENHVAN